MHRERSPHGNHPHPQIRHLLGRRLATLPRGRPRGVPGRPCPQPLELHLAGGRPGPARHQSRRRQSDRRPAAPGPGHRPPGRARVAGPAPRLAAHPAGRAPSPRRGHARRPDPTPGPARPAARLGDRQALAAGPRRRRPGHRRRALVRRRHRADGRRPGTAGRSGIQHRELELPDERARSRSVGTGIGRQRGHRQDPDRRRCRLSHPGLRVGRPRGNPRHPRQRQRERAVGGAGAGARDRLRLLRRRPRHRSRGGHGRRRPRQTTRTRTGRTQHLGHLELHGLGRAHGGRAQALRLRQTALHGVPALRRPARAVRRVPRGVPPGGAHAHGRPPAGGGETGPRPLPAAGLRAGHQRGQGQGAPGPGGRGDRPRRRPAAPGQAGGRPLPARPGHLGIRPAGHAAQSAPVLPAPPRGALRPGRHHRPGRHRGGAAGGDERVQRRTGRHAVHGRPRDVRPPGPADPRVQGRPRQAAFPRRP